jgi:uncharacterized protein YcbX
VIRVSALHLYPIKSCRGVAVSAMELDSRGPAGDRRWMVVDERGRFLTQREEPSLALVDVVMTGEKLVLSAGELTSLALPARPTDGPRREVEIWRDRVSAIEDAEGSRFMSDYLLRRVHLVYMPDDVERRVNPARARPTDLVGFADAYPLLVISEESLADLNGRLAQPLTMTRFRPNVVIAGAEPYAEDAFARVRIGGVSFRGPKRCDRCAITTVDPETGKTGKEPLATLATYRREGNDVFFGMNLIHDGPGTLRVDDVVKPL